MPTDDERALGDQLLGLLPDTGAAEYLSLAGVEVWCYFKECERRANVVMRTGHIGSGGEIEWALCDEDAATVQSMPSVEWLQVRLRRQRDGMWELAGEPLVHGPARTGGSV